ncbi:MAG TPA: hypothetical protein VME23_01450 [Terracidiphilus sp.]|nr:hypothetical protein [Terracidiphilus sp.]
MRVLTEIANFLRGTRRQLRSGELSREPLQLLRVEWKGDLLECDWLMRPVDPWDKYLPPELAAENQTLQALRDALKLRAIIFRSFPAVGLAHLRMFRAGRNHQLELVMTGSVNRLDEEFHRVPSVMMRAKMCGFRFAVAEGAMHRLVPISL